jgi:phosphatidate phosphatase APP1
MRFIPYSAYSNGSKLWAGGMLWGTSLLRPLEGNWQTRVIWRAINYQPIAGKEVSLTVGDRNYTAVSNRFGEVKWEIEIENEISSIEIQAPNEEMHQLDVFNIKPDDPLIFSDIDDTLLLTRVYHPWYRIVDFLKQNPFKKKAIPELDELLLHLKESTGGKSHQPHFIYVSNSEWNLLPFIQASFQNLDIPKGIFLLRRHRVPKKFNFGFELSSDKKKWKRIIEFMEEFPSKNAWLVGDTGQADLWHYLKVCKRFPDRIQEVIFRKHHPEKGTQRYNEVCTMFEELGISSRLI